jgi:hypothetical protein
VSTHAAAVAVLSGGPTSAYLCHPGRRRLRNGGSQFVRVEHVHVNEGGQAVVGTLAVRRTAGRIESPAGLPVLGAAPGFFEAVRDEPRPPSPISDAAMGAARSLAIA